MSNTTLTILVAVLSAVIAAFATLLVPTIQKRLDKKGLSDKEMFRYWRAAFDRSAFRGPFMWHTDQKKFEQALRDTIEAIYTGSTPSQKPNMQGAAKSFLKNKKWIPLMDEVGDNLRNITWALSGRSGFDKEKIAAIADGKRDTAIKLLNQALDYYDLGTLTLPTKVAAFYDDETNL